MPESPQITNDSSTPAPAVILAFALGLCVCVGGAILRPREFWPGYLAAYVFWLGVTVGTLGIRLLHQLTGGQWGRSITRETSAASVQFPLMASLFLPLLLGASYLYRGSEQSSLNPHQAAYLAPGAWLGRAVLYFVLWWLAAWAFDFGRLHRLSRAPDSGMPRLAAVGLCMYWLTTTFAAFDWLMSLEPAWSSTIYGAIVGMAFAVSGMSAAILLRWLAARPAGSVGPVAAEWHDVGNMLLAFMLLWVYFAFSQFFIVWSGDLPQEVVWYQRRNEGFMQWMTVSLILLHFVLPLALLLSRDVKRDGSRLVRVAVLLLLMRTVELSWLVWPALPGNRWLILLFQIATLVAIGALWWWLYWLRYARLAELVPAAEPTLSEITTPGPDTTTTEEVRT